MAWLVLAAGALLRFLRLGDWPLFCDEDLYASAVDEMSRQGVASWAVLPAQLCAKPPLVFALALGLSPLAGGPALALRGLSALAGVGTIACCDRLGAGCMDARRASWPRRCTPCAPRRCCTNGWASSTGS
jgi:4-amino-4-deoxy-L-arabinose transferase-like glycosyltransferase